MGVSRAITAIRRTPAIARRNARKNAERQVTGEGGVSLGVGALGFGAEVSWDREGDFGFGIGFGPFRIEMIEKNCVVYIRRYIMGQLAYTEKRDSQSAACRRGRGGGDNRGPGNEGNVDEVIERIQNSPCQKFNMIAAIHRGYTKFSGTWETCYYDWNNTAGFRFPSIEYKPQGRSPRTAHGEISGSPPWGNITFSETDTSIARLCNSFFPTGPGDEGYSSNPGTYGANNPPPKASDFQFKACNNDRNRPFDWYPTYFSSGGSFRFHGVWGWMIINHLQYLRDNYDAYDVWICPTAGPPTCPVDSPMPRGGVNWIGNPPPIPPERYSEEEHMNCCGLVYEIWQVLKARDILSEENPDTGGFLIPRELLAPGASGKPVRAHSYPEIIKHLIQMVSVSSVFPFVATQQDADPYTPGDQGMSKTYPDATSAMQETVELALSNQSDIKVLQNLLTRNSILAGQIMLALQETRDRVDVLLEGSGIPYQETVGRVRIPFDLDPQPKSGGKSTTQEQLDTEQSVKKMLPDFLQSAEEQYSSAKLQQDVETLWFYLTMVYMKG